MGKMWGGREAIGGAMASSGEWVVKDEERQRNRELVGIDHVLFPLRTFKKRVLGVAHPCVRS